MYQTKLSDGTEACVYLLSEQMGMNARMQKRNRKEREKREWLNIRL